LRKKIKHLTWKVLVMNWYHLYNVLMLKVANLDFDYRSKLLQTWRWYLDCMHNLKRGVSEWQGCRRKHLQVLRVCVSDCLFHGGTEFKILPLHTQIEERREVKRIFD
jgi:hypothetical protein